MVPNITEFLEFRIKMLNGFAYSGFSISLFMVLIGLFTQATYVLYGSVISIICLIVIILSKLKYYDLGYIALLLPLNLVFIIRSLMIDSAYGFLFTITVLVTSSILLSQFSIHLFFVMDITALIYGLISGHFVITQVADPETGLYYANTVTVCLPILIAFYVIALLISKIFIQNITDLEKKNKELRETQAQLIQQEKIKSIQILAGGIAHDFNNILTAVLGNIELVKISNVLDDENQTYIEDAHNALKNARNLTNQLLSFSKPTPIVKELLDINQLLKETVVFSLRGKKSKPIFNLESNLWKSFGDRIQINQVIQNITINADQAMDQIGNINISTSNIQIQSNNNYKLISGDYILIVIEDNGRGIQPEAFSKIFDPFYTTKQSGSGLGLAISYNIVKNHGGTIRFESKVNVGTKFYIYLPAHPDKETPTENINEPIGKWTGYALIMDDDEGVSTVLRRYLKQLGFRVDFTTNGEDAIALYKNHFVTNKLYDLVILDLTIPGGMGGEMALKQIQEINPNVKAILSSGYSKENLEVSIENNQNITMLKKPYTIEELSNALNKLNLKSKLQES